MKNISVLAKFLLFLGVLSHAQALPNTELKLGITADVLSLLIGNIDDIPIIYLDDIGNQLNELVNLVGLRLECGKYVIEDSSKIRIKDLTNVARCLVANTKDSTKVLPVSVNSVLQTITSLLDQSLISVRFIGTKLVKDFENKCAELIPKVEDFIETVSKCTKMDLSKECLEKTLEDEEMNTAIYCIM